MDDTFWYCDELIKKNLFIGAITAKKTQHTTHTHVHTLAFTQLFSERKRNHLVCILLRIKKKTFNWKTFLLIFYWNS